MRHNRLIILLFLLCCCNSHAQYIFTSLQTKDGMKGKGVFCSYKDSEGFMWFGTTLGLNRYDGSNFKIYNRDSKRFPGLADGVVTGIIEYGKNKLWISTSNGLFCYEKQKGIFEPVQFMNEKNELLFHPAITKLLPDDQGHLWIATQQGLFVYKENKALPVSSVFPGARDLNNLFIIGPATAADHLRGGMWIGTTQGLFFMNFKTGEINSYAQNPGNCLLFDSTVFESLAIDKTGDIWFSNIKHLLGCYHFKTNQVDGIKYINDDPRWDLKDGCTRLFVDSKDRLWVSGWQGKAFVKEPGSRFIILPDGSPAPYQLPIGGYYDIYEDDKNNLWIAGANGVSILPDEGFLKNIFELPGNSFDPTAADMGINSIVKAGKDSLWICKDDGLYLLDPKTGKEKTYTVSTKVSRPNRFFDGQLINGEWWFATGDGIKILNPQTGQFRPFTYYAKGFEIKDRSVTWIHQDRHKMIWFSAWADGIYKYNPVTKETTRIADLSIKPNGYYTSVNSLCMLEDKDGKIWLGYGEKGIRIFDYNTNAFTNPGDGKKTSVLSGNLIVTAICEDNEQNKWLATTGNGILKLDRSGNLVDSITSENGLGVSSIYNMIIDPTGRIWATTNEMLLDINPVTKNVSRLDVDLGMPLHDPTGPMLISDGYFFGSMVNKIAMMDLSKVGKFSAGAAPLISGISVFEKEVLFSPDKPAINLEYNQNFFVIEFSSPHHREMASLQYAYRLKGFDKDWVYCGRRQTAAYTNVPDGDYTFMVKCTDANGQWMEKETTVSIFIQSPFWKTWWFIALVFAVAITGARWLYKKRKAKQQEKQIGRTIDYFANSVYGENSVNEICWDIARNCISQLQFEDCVVYLLDKETNRLVQKAAYGPKNPKGHEISDPIEIELGKGIVGTVAANGKPLLVNDTSKDSRYIVDDEQRLSELAVPVLHDGKVIGVIDSEHHKKNFFTEEHLKTLSTIASISANKIAEAQAEEYAKENEIKLLGINKQLAESQLMALRAQMNPHFVFNCLNSIQECIVTQKYGEASDYLNKFSKLFRTILNNSGKDLVTIDEEKEVIKLYLELELMRFDKSFSYEIEVDEDLETDEILMPSMLLQPYVENALWHGLMHKEGERKLLIGFSKVSEDVFRCVIDDNGIGRKKSFELKEQQSKTKRHESKGLKITKDRIDILKQQGYHATLDIQDKVNAAGQAEGTRVIVELSTFLKPS